MQITRAVVQSSRATTNAGAVVDYASATAYTENGACTAVAKDACTFSILVCPAAQRHSSLVRSIDNILNRHVMYNVQHELSCPSDKCTDTWPRLRAFGSHLGHGSVLAPIRSKARTVPHLTLNTRLIRPEHVLYAG